MGSYYEDQIKRIQNELTREKKHEDNLGLAKDLFDIYECHTEAGFTKEQSWEILITLLNNKTKK